MTQKQRERLNFLVGKLEGLTCGVEDQAINEGLCEVVSELVELLEKDASRPCVCEGA